MSTDITPGTTDQTTIPDICEWGVRITWADGSTEVDTRTSRASAEFGALAAARQPGRTGAEAVYRELSGWTSDLSTADAASIWGVRRTWPDGVTEVSVRNGRNSAVYGASLSPIDDRSSAVVVRAPGPWQALPATGIEGPPPPAGRAAVLRTVWRLISAIGSIFAPAAVGGLFVYLWMTR